MAHGVFRACHSPSPCEVAPGPGGTSRCHCDVTSTATPPLPTCLLGFYGTSPRGRPAATRRPGGHRVI